MTTTSTTQFLYGLNPAFEVLRAGRRQVRRALLNKGSAGNPRLAKLVEQLQKRQVPYSWAEKGRLIDLCGSHETQGVVLEASPYPYTPVADLLTAPRLLLLDNVEDPQNVGAILRSAEVFGFTGVLLSDKGVPEVYPSVVKAAAGATEHLRISRECSANDYVKQAQAAGFSVVALDARGATDVRDLATQNLARPLLVIGGENKSVGQFILNTATHTVRIAQAGRVSSLNASVAAGIAMFALGERPVTTAQTENHSHQ